MPRRITQISDLHVLVETASGRRRRPDCVAHLMELRTHLDDPTLARVSRGRDATPRGALERLLVWARAQGHEGAVEVIRRRIAEERQGERAA